MCPPVRCLARTSAPSSPIELVSRTSVCSTSLCDSASVTAVIPFTPMPFLLRSAATHLHMPACHQHDCIEHSQDLCNLVWQRLYCKMPHRISINYVESAVN